MFTLDPEQCWHLKHICELSNSLFFLWFLGVFAFLVDVSIILPLLLSLLGLNSYCLQPMPMPSPLPLPIHPWAGRARAHIDGQSIGQAVGNR